MSAVIQLRVEMSCGRRKGTPQQVQAGGPSIGRRTRTSPTTTITAQARQFGTSPRAGGNREGREDIRQLHGHRAQRCNTLQSDTPQPRRSIALQATLENAVLYTQEEYASRDTERRIRCLPGANRGGDMVARFKTSGLGTAASNL